MISLFPRLSRLGVPVAGAALIAAAATAGDVTAYGIAKGAWHLQTSASGPLATPDGWGAFAYTAVTSTEQILVASVLPASGFLPLFLGAAEGSALLAGELDFGSQAELDFMVPNGTAEFTMFTAVGGLLSGTLSLTGDAYPGALTISNFEATQQVDPAQPVTLQWILPGAAGANDFIVVTVDVDGSTVLQTPLPGQAGALAGSTTSFQIPAGVFDPDAETEVAVAFVHGVQKVSPGIDGGTGFAGYHRTTSVILRAGTGGGGGGDTTPPSLVAVSPLIGAMGVDPASPVVFTFSEPMDPAIDITWFAGGGLLDPSGIQSTWSADARVLTCTPVPPFPAASQIAWSLGTGFSDLAGNALPDGTHVGLFQTGTGSGGGGGGCDETPLSGEGILAVTKLAQHLQTSDAAPVPDPDSPPVFSAVFRAPDGVPVSGVQLTPPGRDPQALLSFPGAPFLLNQTAPDTAGLDAAFPAGTYSATVTPAAGPVRTLDGTLPAAYPPVPTILNFTAAQSVNPDQPFPLQWNVFSGVDADDFVVVEISEVDGDTVFHAPDPCDEIELANTATGIEIPAGTLQSGRLYEGRVSFFRMAPGNPQGSPAITFNLALGRSTRFRISTGGIVPVTPRILNVRRVPSGALTGQIAFDLEGAPNARILVESSENLTAWGPAGTVTLGGDGTGIYQGPIEADGHRYFRARAQ